MLLDAHTLSRLAGVKLRARAVVEGVLAGFHKSLRQGQSVEFFEHKAYVPGDELKHLDWKAYGKFDRYYIRRYAHETSLRALMVVDVSGSMAYGTTGLSKLDVAKVLAATLAHLFIRQQDAAGVAFTSAGQLRGEVPPRPHATHLHVLLDALENATATGPTDLAGTARALAEKLPRRSLVCVFSDCFDAQGDGLKHLLALRGRKHDFTLFQLVDPTELTFPFEDATRFMSLEGGPHLEVHPRDIRESYLEEFHRFLSEVKDACVAADCGYECVRTDEPLDRVILRALARRGGFGRGLK